MTPEGKVKKAVRDFLEFSGAWFFMPVPSGYGTPVLDFIGCYEGRFFAIETKAPGAKLTKRQELKIAEMENAGAAVFVGDAEKVCSDMRDYFAAVENRGG